MKKTRSVLAAAAAIALAPPLLSPGGRFSMVAITSVPELKKQRAQLITEMNAFVAKGDELAAKGEMLTAEDEEKFKALQAKVAAMTAQIERAELVGGLRATIEVRDPNPSRPQPEGARTAASAALIAVENPGFQSLGELLATAKFSPGDSRILALQQMGVGADGGLPIPDELNPAMREISPQEAIFRPRCPIMPAGDAPDADVVMPALDQATENMYGGVAVQWTSEGATVGETGAKLRDVRWTPYEITGSITVTNKLLQNWKAAGPFLDRLLRGAILAAEDVAFLRGNGVGKPQGLLASPALKTVNRAGANDVAYEDLVAMEAELLEDQPAVWVVNPRAIPRLRLMEDGEGHLIWNENARDGGIPSLLGRPVLKNFRSPGLGTKGDVCLLNLAHYIIKEGRALVIDASIHQKFDQNKTVVKAVRSVGGASWLNAPIKQEDGETYSPFVALDVPAAP